LASASSWSSNFGCANGEVFYDSPEYRAARGERAGAANMSMILVEGLSA
jgi:uncharacterized protein (DUF1330 family)